MFHQRQAALRIRIFYALLSLACAWAVLAAAGFKVPVASGAPSEPEAGPSATAAPEEPTAPQATPQAWIPMIGALSPQPTPDPSSAPQPSASPLPSGAPEPSASPRPNPTPPPSASPRPSMPPAPRVPSPDAGSVLQGLFYDRPNDGTTTSAAAKRASWITLSRGNLWRHDLRDAGYEGLILEYFMGLEVEGPGPYANAGASCNANLYPANNTVAHQQGDFCNYIHPNESWFLHNGQGQRIYAQRGNSSVNYQMNPASSGWRQFARDRMARDMFGDGSAAALEDFDGIYLDNIALRLFKLHHQNTNSDGTVREFGDDAGYRSATVAYLTYLGEELRNGASLWANLIDDFGVEHDDYVKLTAQLDGYMNEAWALGYVGSTFSPERWNETLSIAETTVSQGKGLMATVQGGRGDDERQVFGLASYLLVNDGKHASFRYTFYRDGYRSWWQFGNYDLQLGTPKGARYQSGALWRRDFSCGYVTADPTTGMGKIVQTCS